MPIKILMPALSPTMTEGNLAKWVKKVSEDDLELVKEYYGYNNEKARQALSILSDDQLVLIRTKQEKGGIK